MTNTEPVAPSNGHTPYAAARPPRSRAAAVRPAAPDLAARAALFDSLPQRVVVADADLKIVYVNRAMLAKLGTLPHLPVPMDAVVGASLDLFGGLFHSDPTFLATFFADPSLLPYETDVQVGDEALELKIIPITGAKNDFAGAMVWADDVTAQRQLESARTESETDSVAVKRVLSEVQAAGTKDEAVQVALDTVRDAFGWAYGSYWTVESDGALHFNRESGDAGPEFRKVTMEASFREGVGLSGRAWKTRDLFFTPDIGEMTDCVRAPIAQKVGVKSGVCFPIMLDGVVVGTMDFFTTETLDPTPARLDSLRNVGLLVSAALERLARQQETRDNDLDSEAVNQVLERVAAAGNTDEAVQVALDTVRDAFGWAYGSYWTVESDGALHFNRESGDAGPEFRKVTMEASFREGVGLSGRAWKTRDLFFTPDIGEMTDCVRAPIAQKVGVKSGVCFPIMLDDRVLGTMDFFTTETLVPTTSRLNALRNVGRLVSAGIERKDLSAKVDLMLEAVDSVAAGDLTREIPVTGEDAIGRLGGGLEALLTTLRSSMSEIGGTADSLAMAAEQLTGLSEGMGAGASQTSDRAGSSAAASEEVSASIQTVATAAEEMTASISEIAKNASDAASVATTAVGVATGAQTTVTSLGQASGEIGAVIKVITGIAQQTNLLALNATIEAARAGEAGKGFAVVANEVKELAKETARATEDIGQKIESIQSNTQGAVDAISEISTIIDRINDIQTTIASAVEEQTATTNEIARNVTAAATGANGISADVAEVATAARTTLDGSVETQRSANDLAGMATELKRLLGQFQY
ncbi:GAF domain-containing protein [uncultured Jatrophihabitans sp.]|uniref:GAF domain-containing protein n=1 Tax=uncultured Jatrophihabitans sp. TaxID=1610747 RepID=UPI0035CBCB92